MPWKDKRWVSIAVSNMWLCEVIISCPCLSSTSSVKCSRELGTDRSGHLLCTSVDPNVLQMIRTLSLPGHRRTKKILAGAAAAAAAAGGGGGGGTGGGALHASRKQHGRTPTQHRPPPVGFTPKPSPAVPFRHSAASSTRNPQTLKLVTCVCVYCI